MLPQQRALRELCRHPSGQQAEISPAELTESVQARFSHMAATYPDKPAIIHTQHTMSYATIEQMSNRIARGLVAQPDQGTEPIALLIEPGAFSMATALGSVKAGFSYCSLPLENPVERLRYILNDLGARLLVTDQHGSQIAQQLTGDGIRVLRLEDLDDTYSPEPLGIPSGPDTLYCIRYTSGSTGRPKGVMTTHGQLLYDIRNRFETMQLGSEDRVVGFSASYAIATITLMAGATYYDFALRQNGMTSVYQNIVRNQITVVNCKVTTFRQLMRSADPSTPLSHLRIVRLTGEPPIPEDLLAAQEIVPSTCVFTNQYGSTEAHIATQFYATTESIRAYSDFPSGFPVTDAEILLLDEDGTLAAPGEEGEIIVRSPAVCSGYWNLPQETQTRFAEGPGWRQYATGDRGQLDTEGCLHYLGRKDDQVKIRSHRVRLSEVEAMLLGLENVAGGAVVARPGPDGDLRLVAYVVPSSKSLTTSELRLALEKRLPLAMIPAVFVFMDSLPITPSGKVDRLALPEPGHQRPKLGTPFKAPRTPIEATIVHIWQDVLGLDELGLDDGFLDLGGNSLLASQIVGRVMRSLDVDLPLAVLFASPTAGAMAMAVTQSLVGTFAPEMLDTFFAEIDGDGKVLE